MSKDCSVANRRRLIAGWLLSLASCAACPAELQRLEVTQQDKVFRVVADGRIGLPVSRVMERFAQLPDWAEQMPSVHEARLIKRLPEGIRLLTRGDICVFIFCRTLRMTQDIAPVGDAGYALDGLARGSDFQQARFVWRMTPDAEAVSRVRIEGHLQPKFGLPPLIARWLVGEALRRQILELMTVMEQSADTDG
jgi:hypothetical protein